MKVIILAAGQGTRLLPITLETPKPLIEIAGRPIIDRIFQSLPDSIDEAIIVVEHLKEKIISHLGESFNGMKVRYVDQINKKGTFAALLSAKDLLEENNQHLVGKFGPFGQRRGNFALQNADLILSIGASLFLWRRKYQ